ncbi:MAG: hypothetical protein U0232_01430 [Thermomicrobiales bacterium]
MLVERRPNAAAPLCNLSATDSLRLRRRHGRAAYLVALFTERRSKRVATEPARAGRTPAQAARTLPS